MRLVAMQFMTLDGVTQGPGGPDEDTSDGFTAGGWLVPHIDDAFLRQVAAWVGRADAFLFGRRTYQNFARDWPRQTGDPFAAAMNGLPKYVATGTLRTADWHPTTILTGDVPARVADLKRLPGNEIQIHGSARLTHALLTAGLVDELRTVVAPVVLGQGRTLFPHGTPALRLHPATTTTTPSGLTAQTFACTGSPTFATYGAA